MAETSTNQQLQEEAQRLLLQLEQQKREHPILFYVPHAKQLQFHKATQRKRFMGGANRFGKTIAGTVEVEWFARGTHPYRTDIVTPNIGWIVTLDSNVSKQVNWPKIKELFTRGECEFNEREGEIHWRNGSITYIKSCDSGEEKFQGAGLRYIWFDEEPPEKIYRESMARVAAGTRLDIWMTATLLRGLTYPYDEFILPMQEATKNGYVPRDVFSVTGSIADNTYFSPDEVEAFAQSFTGDEYKVRVMGSVIQMGLDSLVSAEECETHMEQDVRPPDCVGNILGEKDAVRLDSRPDGRIKFWGKTQAGKLLEPRGWERFSIGWDVSEGRGYDDSVASCYNVRAREKVAVLRSNSLYPRDMAEDVARMSWFFNNALIVPESNSIGLSAIDRLRELHCRLYTKTYLDKRTQTPSEKVGFRTGSTTRKYLIDQWVAALPSLRVRDIVVIEELKNFVRWPGDDPTKPKYAAQRGSHDDTLFADFLALEGFNQVPAGAPPSMVRLTDFEQMQRASKRAKRTKAEASLGGY